MKTRFFFMMFAGAALCAQAIAADFAQGNKFYADGDYKLASEVYEAAAKERPGASVYYNLGNSYFKLGRKAKALAAYEKALAISPRDKDIRRNRDLAAAGFRDSWPDENLFYARLKDALKLLTDNEWAALFSPLLLISLILYAKAPRLTALTLVPLMIALAAMVILKAESASPKMIVTEKEATARKGPSENEAKAFTLKEGMLVRQTDELKDWVLVSVKKNEQGWAPKTSLEPIS